MTDSTQDSKSSPSPSPAGGASEGTPNPSKREHNVYPQTEGERLDALGGTVSGVYPEDRRRP
jgi:hypothetical protein